MSADLFFEQHLWRQWLRERPRFASEVLVELVERARACTRLDQATFSAAMFEAIWGRPPAPGQKPVPPTRRQGVPPWVLPVLVRGLQGGFHSLPALLDALDPHSPYLASFLPMEEPRRALT